MPPEDVAVFTWPDFGHTAGIVAIVLALSIFVFGLFGGTRGNKIRIIFAVVVSSAIGWFTMPVAVKAAAWLHLLNTHEGPMIVVTIMMVFVAILATSVYEVITVTLPDVGLAGRK